MKYKCEYCGSEKENFTGLCINCGRFPSSSEVSKQIENERKIIEEKYEELRNENKDKI
jgi:predicted ATP-dependent serine protease